MRASTFTYRDRENLTLFAHEWLPDHPPRAVLQIAHGMQEYAGRYERAAVAFSKAGISVVAADLRGHGRSLIGPDKFGHLGPGGWKGVLGDIKQLTEIIQKRHRRLPLFLLGHSWGSFMVQGYIQRWGRTLKGAILSGTNGANPVLRVGQLLAKGVVAVRGGDKTAKLLEKVSMGAYNKYFAPKKTGLEWLSRDQNEVDKYVRDPLCGIPFPNSFFLETASLLMDVWTGENERRIPPSLPIYMFSGTEDPVGMRGKGVRALAARYTRVGVRDLTVKLYDGGRHEMINELNRDQVVGDIVQWMDARLALPRTDADFTPAQGIEAELLSPRPSAPAERPSAQL